MQTPQNQKEPLWDTAPSSTETFQLEKRRWAILITFSFFTFTNAANWLTYASIVDESQEYYSTTKDNIIWFGNTYFITYIVLSYFGSWMAYKYFKYSMLVGTFCGALGCWIRYFAQKNYALAMVGQELNALAQIWVLEMPIGYFFLFSRLTGNIIIFSVIGEIWFPKKEKFLALSIGIFSNFLGNGLSYIFSAAVIGDNYVKSLKSIFFYM